MIKTRRLALDVRYNSYPFAGQVGGDIESLTYTDSAADNSDSIDITINAQDKKWLLGWMPEKGATLRARILGYNWERQGQRSIMECGLFVLDDVSFSDAPTTLQVGGVSKPSGSDFSELELRPQLLAAEIEIIHFCDESLPALDLRPYVNACA